MKPLRIRLQEARKRIGLPWEILERDYLLSWILAGISHTDILRDTLVFKGGTALNETAGRLCARRDRVRAPHRARSASRGQEAFDIRARFSWHRQLQTHVMVEIAEKCAVRDVAFSGPESFFPDIMLAEVEKTWTHWLGPLVNGLPPYGRVIADLRVRVAALLSTEKPQEPI